MSFYTAREVSLNIGNYSIFANSVSLSQDASLSSPYLEGEIVNDRFVADGPIKNSLSINYYLTGKDYLRDHIFVNHKNPLSGSLGGLKFSNAFLESYSLNAEPNSPINIQANLIICDEISGNFASTTPSTPPSNLNICNFNDARFSTYDNYSFTSLDNITNFNWSFRANVEPIYFYSQTGKSRLTPDRVFVGEKSIECNITSDNTNLETAFTGNNYALDLICYHPTNNSIYETYTISGKLFKKDFSISTDNLSQSAYSIRQSSLNEEPKIGSITTSSYPAQNYITIQSPNLTNGYFSNNNNFNLLEKVTLGDRDLKFEVTRGASVDTITGFIPLDAINGTLSVSTTKGLIFYPTQVSLNYSGIGVSGFWPETGNYNDTITISGSNFFRISQVLFNNTPAKFSIYDTTGFYHKLIANVPDNAGIGKIDIISSLRNISGSSTGKFYPIMEITGFTPTGTWSGTCIIGGYNFSGITNVYFNNVKSPSFTVNNNSRITATIPGTGAGYTKGYIKLSGYKGSEALSKSKYQPILKITGVNLLLGGVDEDIAISGIFDPDFLYRDNGGFRVSFGGEYSIFYRQNNFTLTGLIPTGSFVSAKPAMFEPDGVGKYSTFTGTFIQVSKPIIERLGEFIPGYPNFSPITQFDRKDLVLYGKNFNLFIGQPYYIYASGGNGNNEVYPFTDFQKNSDGTQLIIKNVRVTGQGAAGNGYRIVVRNAGGASDEAFYISNNSFAKNLSALGTANQSKNARITVTYNDRSNFPGGSVGALAIDNNYNSHSMVHPFGIGSPYGDISGWWEITFPQTINFGAISVYQDNSIPVNSSLFGPTLSPYNPKYYYYAFSPGPSQTSYLANTGMLQCFDLGGDSLFKTGIDFNSLKILTNEQVITGVKRLKIYRNDNEPRYLAFSEIGIYD